MISAENQLIEFPPNRDPSNGEIAAAFLYRLGRMLLWVGVVGGVILYAGSLFAKLAWSVFSDQVFFHGRVFGFIAWCGSLLDRHLIAYFCYVGGLIGSGAMLLLFAKFAKAFGPRSASLAQFAGWIFPLESGLCVFLDRCAIVLLLPFIPTLIGALAGFVFLALAFVIFVVYGSRVGQLEGTISRRRR